MPDDNREVQTAFAVIVCFALVWALGVWNGTYSEARRAHYQRSEAKPYQGTLEADTYWDEHGGSPDSYASVCNSPIDETQADLCQQWRSANAAEQMAGYAFASLLLGLVGLVGVGVTVYLTNKATKAATKATVAAEKAYLADNRPWMDVTCEFTGDMIISRTGISAVFTVTANNSAKVPARDVQVFARLIQSGPFSTAGSAAVESELRRRTSDPNGFSSIVLPERDTALSYNGLVAVPDPDTQRRDQLVRDGNPGKALPDNVNLTLIYGVVYRAVVADEWFHTAYLAVIFRTENKLFHITQDIETVTLAELRATIIPNYTRLA